MNSISLAQLSLVLGALGAAASLWQWFAPAQVRRMLDTLPRSTPAAWTLTAIDLLWVAWLINGTPLGNFEPLKPALYFVAPLCFFLLINFLDELLAIRALGGLLLLVASPVLKIAQWHDSDWRLVITTLAYLWVVIGMILVMSPYVFRRTVQRLLPNNTLSRVAAVLKLAVSAGLIVLGLRVF